MKQIGCYEIKWSSQTGCVFLHYRWMTGEWKIFGRKAKIVSFTVYAIHMSNWVSGSRGEERSSTCQRAHRGKGRVQSTSWRKKKYPRRSSLFSAFFFFFSTEHEGAFPFTSSIPIWDLGFFFFLSLFPSTARSSQLLALPTGHRPIGRLLVGTLYYISCSFHLVLENLHPPISFSTLFLLDTFSEDELDYLKPPFAHLKSVLSRSQFRKQPTREEVRFSSKSCVLGACRHPVSYCSWRFLLVCFTFL